MSSSMEASGDMQQNNKRRKICTDINITDLDDEAIRRVAIFLPKTSRALLAVALTTESSKWNDVEWTKSSTPSILSLWGNLKKKLPCQATKAILSPSSTGTSTFIEYTTERNQTIFKEVRKLLLNIPREERTVDHTNTYLQNVTLQYDAKWLEGIRGKTDMFYDNDIQCKVTKYCNILNHRGSFRDRYFNMWSELDFGDIEFDLARRLTDDDIAAVLSCINAFKKLKTLILTGCVAVSGKGLLPLQGSKVLERLDMSLVERGDSFDSECTLSKAIVVPILDRIIDMEDNSLKYIQFPKSWQYYPNVGELDTFLLRYKQSYSQANMCCTSCTKPCQYALSNGGSRVNDTSTSQDFTCYNCLNNFCYSCGVGTIPKLAGCQGCEKEFCSDCVKMIPCATCPEDVNEIYEASYYCSSECAKRSTCNDCERVLCGGYGCSMVNTCKGCGRSACGDCMSFVKCEEGFCSEEHCVDCFNDKQNTNVQCGDCKTTYCFNHRLNVLGLGSQSWEVMTRAQKGASMRNEMCFGCLEILVPKLIASFDSLEVEKRTPTLLSLEDNNKIVSFVSNHPMPCEECKKREISKVTNFIPAPNLTFEDRLKECRKIRPGGDWKSKRYIWSENFWDLNICSGCSGCLKMCMLQLAQCYEERREHNKKK